MGTTVYEDVAGLNYGNKGQPIDQKIYNVLEYGARGDGSNDDTNAIQAAINAMTLTTRHII